MSHTVHPPPILQSLSQRFHVYVDTALTLELRYCQRLAHFAVYKLLTGSFLSDADWKKNSWFLGRPSLNWHRENLRKVKTTLEIFTTAPNEWRLDDIDFIASTICPNLSKGAKNVLYFTCLLPNILTLLMCYISFNVQRPKTRIISTAFWASP